MNLHLESITSQRLYSSNAPAANKDSLLRHSPNVLAIY